MGLQWVARLRLLPLYSGKGKEEGEEEEEEEGSREPSREDGYHDIDCILQTLEVRNLFLLSFIVPLIRIP